LAQRPRRDPAPTLKREPLSGGRARGAKLRELRPDGVDCTALTPAIYKAERSLQIAREVDRSIVAVVGGIHVQQLERRSVGLCWWRRPG
jgi:hypothetical protein